MPYKLIFPAPYQKQEKAFLKKHPELRERYFKTLLLLEQDPFHPSLRLHPSKDDCRNEDERHRFRIKARAYERSLAEDRVHNFPTALPEYLAEQA